MDRLDTSDAVAGLVDQGHWTIENLREASRALKREGIAELPPGSARDLTANEKLHVTRLAQQGKVIDAIGQFLAYSLDEEEPRHDLAYIPHYRDVCDRATLFCFEAGQLDYTPTNERREFLRRYCAGRPLTIAILLQAWSACQHSEAAHERNELLGVIQQPNTESPTQSGLDALDDQSLDCLYHDSLRQYAKAARRTPGVLV